MGADQAADWGGVESVGSDQYSVKHEMTTGKKSIITKALARIKQGKRLSLALLSCK